MKMNEKIRRFIEKIPENGAVGISGQHDYNIISKINGSIEFVLKEGDDWNTIYMWDFQDEPEKWEEHFSIEDMPRKNGKKYSNVFI